MTIIIMKILQYISTSKAEKPTKHELSFHAKSWYFSKSESVEDHLGTITQLANVNLSLKYDLFIVGEQVFLHN